MFLLTPIASGLLPLPIGEGAGWVLYEVESFGDGFRAVWEMHVNGAAFSGVEVTPADPAWTPSTGFLIYGGREWETVVSSPEVRLETASIDSSWPTSFTTGWAPGSYRVLLFATGHVDRFDRDVVPLGATTVREIARGTTDLYFSDGAGSATGTHAHVGIDGYGAAYSDSTYTFDVERRFVGMVGWRKGFEWGSAQVPSDSSVTLHWPNGSTASCYCRPDLPYGASWQAGTYRIEWEGADLYSRNRQPILLAGIDHPMS